MPRGNSSGQLLARTAERDKQSPERQSIENVLGIVARLLEFLPADKRRGKALRELIDTVTAWAIDRRNTRVVANTRLVWKYGVNYYKAALVERGLDPDDAFQEGVGGLLHAAELFDESRGKAFGTYAVGWIRSRIQRFLHQSYLVAVPTHLFMVSSKKLNSMSVAELERRAQGLRSKGMIHLGGVEGNYANDAPAENTIVDRRGLAEESRTDDRLDVQDLMRCLRGQERQVIALRFLIGYTLDQVAEQMADGGKPLTRERIRQVEVEAILRMKKWAEERRRVNGHSERS